MSLTRARIIESPPPSTDAASAGVVWPNFCNVGVVGRLVLALNLLGIVLAWSAGVHYLPLGDEWATLAALTEPPLIATLAVLCALRPLALRLMAWAQYGLAMGVPLMMMALWLSLIGPFMAFAPGRNAGMVALAGLTGLASLHYFKLRARALSPAWAEARLQALQARINPHFLFNSLNAALSLVRTDPPKAEQTLENLAELFRAFMRDTAILHPLADELELCRQYAQIEMLRLGERLRIDWQVPEPLPEVWLPQLTLQPLLENAVLHGIEPVAQGGVITVAIAATADHLIISITNPIQTPHPGNQRSNPQSGRNRMAMANIGERLRLIYDLGAQLVTQVNGAQYIVTLKIPRHLSKDVTHVRRPVQSS